MPWTRSGTVSVAQNSATVTGTGTDFAANCRVGDAFIGPDGRQYEITNATSSTVISILPAYMGPTAAGAIYAIVPIQGYNKQTADALRQASLEVGDALDGLEESVQQAADSASAALASKNAAATSETNAGQSAAAALASKNAAGTSETNAGQSAAAALASKNSAANSETNAGQSATAALASKNAAGTSETNAAQSASAAAAAAAGIGITACHIQGLVISRNAAGVVGCSPGSAYIPSLSAVLKVPSALTVNLTGLTANTIYHLYLYSASGTPTLEVSATPPVVYSEPAFQKTGDTSRRYIGSILASAANDCYPFKHVGDLISYNTAISVAPFLLLSGTRVTVGISVSVLGCAPGTATHVRTAMCNNINTVPNAYFANADAGTVTATNYLFVLGGVAGQAWTFAELGLDSTGAFSVVVDAGGSSGGVFVRANGYRFRR